MNKTMEFGGFAHKAFALVAALSLVFGMLPIQSASATTITSPYGTTPVKMVDICHSTPTAYDNGVKNVSVNAVFSTHALDITGGTNGMGDIIPPFYYEEKVGRNTVTNFFIGKNWSPTTIAIWNNDCNVPPKAIDLSVTKIANDTTPDINQSVAYTITVSNAGPDAATNVVVMDTIPTGTTFVNAVPAPNTTSPYKWNLGTIASGANKTVIVNVTVNSGTGGQTIVNTANATGTEKDSSTLNNTVTEDITVNLPPITECPTGYTGTYPDCVAPQCPTGYTGNYPTCVAPDPQCPIGYTGTYPTCVAPVTECPTGQTGTYPNCVTPQCPTGYTGTYPDCVAPQCPTGYTGTYPTCVAPVTECPTGQTGTYPNCLPIDNGGGDDEIPGCTDESATNYNANATVDNDTCVYPVAACAVGENLLANGSFETPTVPSQWNIFAIVANWFISTDGLELWKNFNGNGAGLASEGMQNAELDGNAPTKITQNVATTPGATYELRFDFSPRAGTALADNSIDGLVNGTMIINASGTGATNSTNAWTTHSQTFVATGTSTEIGFEDKGTANSLGSLIDNTKLCFVRGPVIVEPAPICSTTVVSDASNTVNGTTTLALVIPLLNQPGVWVDNIVGSIAQWIWGSPAGSSIDPVNDETQTFVKTFTWSGPIDTAILKIASDNMYQVKVNGVSVATDTNPVNFTSVDLVDVETSIVQGVNTLEILVTNDANGATVIEGNPAGLLYDLTVNGNNVDNCKAIPDDRPTPTPTPMLACTIEANATSIDEGDDVVLTWSSTGAASAQLGSTNVATTGLQTITNVENDTTYSLTVTGSNESEVTCSVSVDINSGGGNGGGGTRVGRLSGRVAGASTDATPLVLGEQVSAVPNGAPNAGAGGTARTVVMTLSDLLIAPRRRDLA